MTILTSHFEDSEKVHRFVELTPDTRFVSRDRAKVLDCTYCAHFLGKYAGFCVCNEKCCEAELTGYNALELYSDDALQEVTA